MGAIFDQQGKGTVSYSMANATVQIDGETLVALNAQIQFNRNVQVIPTLDANNMHIDLGTPQGTFSCDALLGSSPSAFDSMCDSFTCTITPGDQCQDTVLGTFKCENCYASSINIQAQGGRGYVSAGFQATFTKLTVS